MVGLGGCGAAQMARLGQAQGTVSKKWVRCGENVRGVWFVQMIVESGGQQKCGGLDRSGV